MQFKYMPEQFDIDVRLSSSQAGQDLFVLAMTQGKQNGTFLEIGAGNPCIGSNCYMLEKFYNWSGISIDKKIFNIDWSIRPNTKFYNIDVQSFDTSGLSDHYDYLQIDVDNPLLGYDTLERCTSKSDFSVITFEHDIYTNNPNSYLAKNKAKKLLDKLGYTLLINNVTCPKIFPQENLGTKDIGHLLFEDWYVNPKFTHESIIKNYKWVSHDYTPKYFYDILFA